MKNLKQKILNFMAVFLAGFSLITPIFSTSSAYAISSVNTMGAQAAILTGCAGAENGSGEGIKCVIRLVVDILSVLVGIVGVIGIVIVGIQYMTAGGNEEQTRKAKRRLFEIVIGLVAYAVVYALLAWLLPGFDPSTNSTSYAMPILGVVIGA
ncbi:hypothetical protein IKF23_01230 [Candidatus Saccharibacteria bacterium]|nr:hypothetical protein [Candidatus Saccharibacteria bacterium]